MLDSRPRGRGFEPHRRHCVVSLSKNINPSLVLVQPRKTRPFITERLLMGRKESNQTKQTINLQYSGHVRSILVWKKTLNLANIRHIEVNSIIPFSIQIYLKSEKGAQQDMYNLLNKTTDINTGKISWNKKYKFEEDEWGKIFSDPFKINKGSKVQYSNKSLYLSRLV